jgi:Domain of unknown function (DUF4404)
MTMPNADAPDTPSLPDIRARLHDASQLLRNPMPIDPDVRRALADLVDELGQALESPNVPPAEVARLAAHTAQLTEALHQGHDRGLLEQARIRMKDLALQVETRSPTAVHLVENLINALANIGI